MTTVAPPADAVETDSASPGRGLRTTLIAILVVAGLATAGAVGYLVGHRSGGGTAPTASSADAGFAWDMSVHHRQAVSMAGFVRDHSSDPAIKLLAYDIESSQNSQVGEMQGWLETWGLPFTSPNAQMSWMSGHSHLETDGLMPGLATPAEVDKLQSLSGKALDVDFLQLMLRHHQGGLPMAQYAAANASTSYVRNAAQKMATSQSGEIIVMEGLLRERGASPLAPPA